MGFWFNNFQEFERKQKQDNHLILNFYYVPSQGEEARKVKILAEKKIKISTSFLPEENAEQLVEKLKKDSELSKFELKKYEFGKFSVFEIEMPKNPELIKQLPKKFEACDYDKMLRLDGFFPERKAKFLGELEKRVLQEDVIELDSLESIEFGELLTESEVRGLPWLYIDIEKPLWKNEREKNFLRARQKLLKFEKKYGNKDGRQEKRQKAIRKLEDWLTIEVGGVGKVRLWQEEYDAAVSFITTVWKNCQNTKTIKELFVLDPKSEFDFEEVNGYKAYKFRTEKELISFFLENVDKRKPVAASGHNEVYDITQIRFAADENKEIFNPAVKGVRPRRDLVRDFFQRMKEDLIYLDTLWLNATFFPWLKQRRFSNLKLETVSQYHGIEFKKSLTHEQLREVELQRLAGQTEGIRKEAAMKLANYAASDVEPVVSMMESLPFLPLIVKLKQALPFCTLTEIAFHPDCVQKYHDKKHFDRVRNHRHHSYKQKEREDKIQIFKKRFPTLKKEMLKWAKVSVEKDSKEKPVYEIYLPFEEWIRELAFKSAPEFHKIYSGLAENEKIPFLQYLKALERDMLVDYYFARRDIKILNQFNERQFSKGIEQILDKELRDRYIGSFKYLKNHFRSVYVPLNGKGRASIRPTKHNLEETVIPEIMEEDADLFLLREKAEKIRSMLSPAQERVLSSFLKNFETLETIEEEASQRLSQAGINEDAKELLYIYAYRRRVEEAEKQFYARYRFPIEVLTSMIGSAYKALAADFNSHNTKVLEIAGDYLFVQADERIKTSKLFYIARELAFESYGKQSSEPKSSSNLEISNKVF